MNRIRANGLEFAYLEEGDGPLVLLLHGFPDSARSWSHQMRALAAADYRAVAPYLRGYPPSEIPRDGFYDKGTLVADIAARRDASGRLALKRPIRLHHDEPEVRARRVGCRLLWWCAFHLYLS